MELVKGGQLVKGGSVIVEFEATSVPSNPSPFGMFDSGISAAELLKPKFEANYSLGMDSTGTTVLEYCIMSIRHWPRQQST